MTIRRRQRENLQRLRKRIVVLAAIAVMAVVSLLVIREILLDNARRMGNEMARSYSADGEKNVTAYMTLLQVSTAYIDSQMRESTDSEAWVQAYLKIVSSMLGSNVIDPYAVIDGKIIAANPWEGDDDYDATSTQWYQDAVAADGEIIFTDGYEDVITGKLIITLAQESEIPGNVVAFDIFPESFRQDLTYDSLPEGSTYLLCDSSGTLLYDELDGDTTKEQAEDYVETLLGKIRDGASVGFDSDVADLKGERHLVYYYIADNGWISIITIPYGSLMQGVRILSVWFIVIFAVFFITQVIAYIRESRMNRDYQRTNDTVRVLGNSYYAIYRIDFMKNTYEMIKGSDYVRRRIPPKGEYDLLLKTAGEVMQAEVFDDFRESFSIDNIRRLVAKRTRDYGGDFLRLFGDVYRWVNVRILFDESLNPEEAVLCFREVDEDKKQQLGQVQLLKEALNAAKKSEESKNSFFSNMSHDMRTPLNAIIGLTELAEKNPDDKDKVGEYLGKINYSSKQLLGLINDVLEMSRLESGKVTLDNRHFNLKKCVQDCADMFREQAIQEGVTLSTDIDVHMTEVYGDSFRLTQILNNLLSNAVKFSLEGGEICLSVRETEQKDYSKYQITVSDTGIGMSEEFLDKIYLPYEREQRFGAKNVSGTGLGMAITKNIISQMNGEIDVKSRLGEGTTFTVTIPFKCIAPESSAGMEAAEQKTQQDEDFLKGKRILLAEDNEINMEIENEILTMCGAEVVKAWNGKEAVEIFEQSSENTFDVVLMDMQMPEMNGCDAARAIRKLRRPDAKRVPIIAVTANAFAEDIAATSAAGMNAHVSKPIDFKLLCRTLAEVTERPE